jgi:hypothetical protein
VTDRQNTRAPFPLQRLAFQAAAYCKAKNDPERRVAFYIALTLDEAGYSGFEIGDCATACLLSPEQIVEALSCLMNRCDIVGGPFGFTFPGLGAAGDA